jgi:hypothetical protein
VSIFGGCAGGEARPSRYARSLNRLPRSLVLAAQPQTILTVLHRPTMGMVYETNTTAGVSGGEIQAGCPLSPLIFNRLFMLAMSLNNAGWI